MKKIFATLVLSVAMSSATTSWAMASGTEWVCTGTTYDPYLCTAEWGYAGSDSYNLDQYSWGPINNRHGCTSFAGYMLSAFNAHNSMIYHFDSAQYWDNQAPTYGNATVGIIPHVGDIAQWEASSVPLSGHVAYVKEVKYNSNNVLQSIVIADDNFGLHFTTQRRIYVGSTSSILSWPDHFLTFPSAPSTPGSCSGGGVISWVPASITFDN
jgi:surface antigen